jgi:ribonuclease Z
MRPLFHPCLVNGRYGDPAVYVETMFENRALLFDLGDIAALPPRKIHRIERIFISHTHIDHFIGFDHLLRVLVGRERTVHLYGPSGLGEAVHHKLQGYRWDLAESYADDLVFDVSELTSAQSIATTRFRLKTAFAPELLGEQPAVGGVLCTGRQFQVSAAILEHHTSCLGFALQEAAHVNIWKNRLAERGLPVGPWLQVLKTAVAEGNSDYHLIGIDGTGTEPRLLEVGALRDLLTVTAGQKIGYVTDVADTAANRDRIVALVRDADVLFIEAAFAAADGELARQRAHLTTKAAGEIARAANARRIEAFHFSPRYAEAEQQMLDEVTAAFAGA